MCFLSFSTFSVFHIDNLSLGTPNFRTKSHIDSKKRIQMRKMNVVKCNSCNINMIQMNYRKTKVGLDLRLQIMEVCRHGRKKKNSSKCIVFGSIPLSRPQTDKKKVLKKTKTKRLTAHMTFLCSLYDDDYDYKMAQHTKTTVISNEIRNTIWYSVFATYIHMSIWKVWTKLKQ